MADLFIGNRMGASGPSKIDISSATVTLASSSFVYDGTNKTQGVSSVVVNGVTLTAGTDYTITNNVQTNAGTYTLSITGTGNYEGTVTADWSIAKAAGSVSVNPTSMSIVGAGNTDTATISVVGDGTVSVGTSASGVATATRSGNTVTVTSVGSGNATITITLAAGTNYTGNSATISVSVIVADSTLANNTPATIQAVARSGMASSVWSVGDRTAAISIAAFSGIYPTSACAFILGFNHNSSIEGNGIHFQFGKTTNGKDICFYSLKMNSIGMNSGGWNGSPMRTTHCSAFLAALPSEWQAVIADCDKYSDNTGGGSDTASYVTKTTDKIFLLAEYEVFGARFYANSAEQNYQAQYTYYANGNPKDKYQHKDTSMGGLWWLRSVYALNGVSACLVGTGTATHSYEYNSYGFAPGFKIA